MIIGEKYPYRTWPEGAIKTIEEFIPGERYYRFKMVLFYKKSPEFKILPFTLKKIYPYSRETSRSEDENGACFFLSAYNIPKFNGYPRFVFKNYWLAHALRCRTLMEWAEKEAKL